MWVAMADHFLDTETRQDIPFTALRCVRAGLSTIQARDVWRYEVSPAVAFNLWLVAGEWAGWDREWLVEQIERVRRNPNNRPGVRRWLRYRRSASLMDGVWNSIGRCVDALLAAPTNRPEALARDLASLARHYFDFCPQEFDALPASERTRLRRLYPEPFRSLLKPALGVGEAAQAERRLRFALEKGAS